MPTDIPDPDQRVRQVDGRITGTTLAVDILPGNRCSQCGHPAHGKGTGPVECYADEITNPPGA